jgi:hypothetical protein
MQNPPKTKISKSELISVALEEVGYTNGTNRDSKYGKWYGLNNNPYSAMFISWCFAKIGASELVEVSSKKGFASCNIGYEHLLKNSEQIQWWRVREGDLAFYDFEKEGRATHVGIVVGVVRKWGLTVGYEVVEGDTTSDQAGSDTEGARTGVYKRVRVIGSELGFFRVWKKEKTVEKSTASSD